MRTIAGLLLALLLGAYGSASAQDLCASAGGEYPRALCLYRAGRWGDAEKAFAAIVRADRKEPETLKSRYFLARSLMRQKKWNEASEELRRIYSISPAFYQQWSCDFLLGETRRAMGLD